MTSRNPSADQGPTSLHLALRLWRDYLSRYWPKIAVSMVAMATYAASASAIPAGVEMINGAFTTTPEGRAITQQNVAFWGPLLILCLGAANASSQYIQSRLSASAALAALRDLQNDMFAKLVAIDDAQLRSLGTGQTVARLTNDTNVLRETLTRASNAVRDLLTLVGLLGVMFWYDWALFLVVFVVYPALGWPVGRIGKFLRQRSKEAQDQAGEISQLGAETVAAGRLVRAYQLEAPVRAAASAVFDRRLLVLRRMAHLRALNEPFIFFVGSIALAIIVAVVAVRISAGALNISELISFIIALLLLSQPARGLSTLNAVAQEGFGAFERIAALLDMEPTIGDAPGAKDLVPSDGAVSFDNVSFAYETDAQAVKGLSFEAAGGQTLALVGESGAGKSTVFSLLLRLYDADSGDIVIDGANIRDCSLSSVRRHIALVSQETNLFDDTIRANIAFGRLDASDDDVIAAARSAAAHDFIQSLPNGYDTRVGEAGLNLSGGQRQRIAIARAFLRDAPILLLDEATAALDAETERQVQDALKRLCADRTTIIIAHRLATVLDADRILVMQNGRIIETGDHETLLAKGGVYHDLARLQFQQAAS